MIQTLRKMHCGMQEKNRPVHSVKVIDQRRSLTRRYDSPTTFTSLLDYFFFPCRSVVAASGPSLALGVAGSFLHQRHRIGAKFTRALSVAAPFCSSGRQIGPTATATFGSTGSFLCCQRGDGRIATAPRIIVHRTRAVSTTS